MVGVTKDYFDYRYHDGIDLVNGESGSMLKLGGCTEIKGTQESLITAAKRKENVIFHSLDPHHKFIDFVYRFGDMFYAFQVSMAANHSCDPKHFSELAEEAGGQSKVILHYLTLKRNYNEFALRPSNPLANLDGNDWTIYVVRVPRPDDKHKGPTRKKRKESYLPSTAKSHLVLPYLKQHPLPQQVFSQIWCSV